MRTIPTLALLAAAVAAAPLPAQEPPGPGEVVALLLRHMESKDADAMRVLTHPEARLVTSSVREGAPVASVWTRYDFFVDGALSHCGVDHALLVLTLGGWRIIHLPDTRTTEGCSPP
jgi:hypothetical protein